MSARHGLVADLIRFSCVDGPGNRFVVFLQGCNFDCIACHNPHTIPTSTPQAKRVSVADLVAEIGRAAPFLSGITASGGEPTQQPDFLIELFTATKADPALARLTTLVDTNGSADRAVWDRLMPVMDGAMVDLKSFDAELHERMTGQPNAPVLDSIEYLGLLGKLEEVRMLLVPGLNDDPALLAATAAWLGDVAPGVRVKLIGFRRHGVRARAAALPEPTQDQLADYRVVFDQSGLTDLVVV